MRNIEEIIKKKVINELKNILEQKEYKNYMFFENLKEMRDKCDSLLNLDKNKIDSLLLDGHDWADDHITVAKGKIDDVYEFMMNKESINEIQIMDEAKHTPTNPKLWSQCLSWARSKYKVCPSAYCNGAAAKRYKSKGGKWKTKK